MPNVMLQFRSQVYPTLQQVAELFEVDKTSLDQEFGVVATDQEANLYVVLIEESAIGKINLKHLTSTDNAEGIFSDPHISSTQ